MTVTGEKGYSMVRATHGEFHVYFFVYKIDAMNKMHLVPLTSRSKKMQNFKNKIVHL